MQFCEHVPLAPYTTFKIGGPARWFADAASEANILEAVEFAREREIPLFALGGGSNLLVSDEGFPGLVLRVALKGIEPQDDTFNVASGEDWDTFVSHAVERGYAGIECLAGIPGTVGGTPIQNVGAYGQEVSETITRVRVLRLDTLKFEEFSNADCGFAYRRSIFNTTERGKFIVTRVGYQLHNGAAPKIAYADLKRHFQNASPPSLREVRRRSAADSSPQRNVYRSRRSGLPERRQLLQKSSRFSGAVRAHCGARAGRNSALSSGRWRCEDSGGMAAGARWFLQRVCARNGRDFHPSYACSCQSRGRKGVRHFRFARQNRFRGRCKVRHQAGARAGVAGLSEAHARAYSTVSSTSRGVIASSAISRKPSEIGSENRRGPALPGLK